MPDSDLPILVAGGGLGGLSVAAALGQRGRRVQVLEQAPQLAPIGYGIQLGPNVFAALDRLGLTGAVLQASHFPPSLLMPDALTGEVLLSVPVNSSGYTTRFKRPYVVIHRADLHDILLDACGATPGVELVVSATVADFVDLGDRVRVACEDGRTFEGAALIGADGLRSRVRQAVVGDHDPKPIGYVAHRTIIDMQDLPPDTPHRDNVVLWAGPGYHVVHYPLRNRTLFNIVAVFRTATFDRPGDLTGYTAEVEKTYRSAHPALRTLLSKMDLERRWVIADRDPVRQWGRGRVTLLGDAAHPTLQSYAQGAGMAIEDAVCMADALDSSRNVHEQAFSAYQRARLLRTARVQIGSRSLWEFYHAEGIARDVRNADARSRDVEDHYRCLAWLWNDAIPAAPRLQAVAQQALPKAPG